MVSTEIEYIVNAICTVIMFLSFIILFFVSYRLLKHKNRSYIETSFGWALVLAAVASLEGAIVRSFYVIFTSGPLINTWKLASFVYFIFMSISLTLVLTVALGILGGRKYFLFGFLSVVATFPISYGTWFIEGAVTSESGFADINATLEGAILVYGILGLQIIINAVLYYYIHSKTKNKGSLYIVYGMVVIALSAVVGGISDMLGDLGRFFDPLSYIGILIGLYCILTAVEILNHDFSRFLPYFAK
ncbi:MAG: hypothetical protein ACFE95_21135 [Candidatus Hodarchaeota archaeon]